MNLPTIITAEALKELAPPHETHAVRVLLHKVSNSGPYRFRCGKRQYVFTRDGFLGIHTLVVPLSLWMDGVPSGMYRDNPSISHDFKSGNLPWTFQVIPLGSAAAAAAGEDYLTPLRDLLSKLGAPDEVRQAFEIIEAGRPAASLREYLDSITAGVESPTIEQNEVPYRPVESQPEGETPAQARARKMREAKAAKKLQLQTA